MSSQFPPPGSDDYTIVPQKRLKLLLGQFEQELNKIRSVFQQHFPGQFKTSKEFEREFWILRHSAEELGADYTFLVEKIISDYEAFQRSPDQTKLDMVFRGVKSLELLLVG